MRKIFIALSLAAFAAGSMTVAAEAAKAPAKTKMGCIIGKEKWNAVDGKCMAAAPVKKAAPKKA